MRGMLPIMHAPAPINAHTTLTVRYADVALLP